MQVRIRHEEDIRGRPFCEIEPTQEAVDRLIVMLRQSGGINYYDEQQGVVEVKNIEYRFCLDEDGAYCELMLSYDEE